MKKIGKQKNNGITLIALVITIIVLLILAGVSIATLTGENGVLTKASEAGKQTEIAEIKEMAQTDILAKQTENEGDISKEEFVEILNKYFKDVPTAEELPEDLSTLILTTKAEYGNYDINISEVWNGTFPKTIESLKAGDKVYYDTGVSSVGDNGVIECVVLYDTEYNETNGTNYGVQIISADTVDMVTLGDSDFNTSRDSYNNALKTLYDKAQKYLNPIYATSSRCVGSKPDEPDWDTEEMFVADSSYTYMNNYNNTFKVGDENYNIDWTQMENITNVDIKIASDIYWLASRVIGSYRGISNFNVYAVSTTGSWTYYYLCDVNTTGAGGKVRSYGFRPVFTLKSGLKITEGDGVDTPYTLAP